MGNNNLNYYIYLSKPKVDMLYSQLSNKIKYFIEAKLKIGFFTLSHQANIDAESECIYKLKKIISNLHNIKSIFDINPSYIKGNINLEECVMTTNNNAIYWIGESNKNGHNVKLLLIGSGSNLIGMQKESIAEMPHCSQLCYFVNQFYKELEVKHLSFGKLPFGEISSIIRMIFSEYKLRNRVSNSEYEFFAKCLKQERHDFTNGETINYIIATPIYVAKK